MSVSYKAIQWNRQKIIYDLILLATVALYVYLFITVTFSLGSDLDMRGVRIRAYGSAAFVLLHVILSIGPLSRLSPKFYPLLFNRRHMGVTMFVLSLIHVVGLNEVNKWINARLEQFNVAGLLPDAWKSIGSLTIGAETWYHDFGNLDPWVSIFLGNSHYGNFILFPFEFLGVLALVIFFVMAATSHDFWLANLTAPLWKAIHMSVYVAYALLVGHVVLGALQTNKHPLLTIAVLIGLVWILAIHFIAARKERQQDKNLLIPDETGFVPIGTVAEIPENRAKVVTIGGERVAVFKYDGKVSAISNVCQHQNGPLGEGKVIDGCITCPWHGYQYLPDCGASPPPFHERVPTFDVKVEGDRVFVRALPNPPGTPVEPALIPA